jgi:hypothetical protein
VPGSVAPGDLTDRARGPRAASGQARRALALDELVSSLEGESREREREPALEQLRLQQVPAFDEHVAEEPSVDVAVVRFGIGDQADRAAGDAPLDVRPGLLAERLGGAAVACALRGVDPEEPDALLAAFGPDPDGVAVVHPDDRDFDPGSGGQRGGDDGGEHAR